MLPVCVCACVRMAVCTCVCVVHVCSACLRVCVCVCVRVRDASLTPYEEIWLSQVAAVSCKPLACLVYNDFFCSGSQYVCVCVCLYVFVCMHVCKSMCGAETIS